MAHVDEESLPWIQPTRECDCIVDRLMGGMKPVVKGIDNKGVGALYVFPFALGHRFHVGDVGQCVHAAISVFRHLSTVFHILSTAFRILSFVFRLYMESHDGQLAVHHADGCDGERAYRYRCMGLDVCKRDGRNARIASFGRGETVWDALHEVFGHEVFSIYSDVAEEHSGTYVVDSTHMVEMFVGDEDAVDVWKFWQRYHLFAEVGAAVDEQVRPLVLHQG